MSELYIKNMVCHRCILVVAEEMKKLGYPVIDVQLGEVTLDRMISEAEKQAIGRHLSDFGFELIDDRKSQLINQIKIQIIDVVQNKDSELNVNLSEFLSSRLHKEYSVLSSLFSEVEGTTIEQYFIAQKIEKVKELLVYDEMTLSEIAFRLHYSSVAHLSNQFKKVTGLTPSHFKKIKANKRQALDKV